MENQTAQTEKKTRVFYSKYAVYGFTVFPHGEDGKPIYEMDDNGNPKRTRDGKKIKNCVNLEFSTVTNPKDKMRPESCFILQPDAPMYAETLEALEKMVEERGSGVMSEDGYRKKQNPEKWESDQKVKSLETENKKDKDIIANLQAQLKSAQSGGRPGNR